MTKQWRWIAEHPDYIVSDQGDVRHRRVNAQFLVGDTDPKGYRRVGLGGKHYRVARLVCEAFHGPCPQGRECGHLNGNKNDNSAANLAWVTRSENARHTVQHGRHRGAENLSPGVGVGEDHPNCRYSDDLVAEMRASGLGARRLSRTYGISKSHAGRVLAGLNRAESGDAQG